MLLEIPIFAVQNFVQKLKTKTKKLRTKVALAVSVHTSVLASMLSAYYLVSLLSAGIQLTLFVLLLGIRLPHRPEWQKFRIAHTLLAVACLLLFFSNVTAPYSHDDESPLGTLIVVCVSPWQALLFTSMVLVMILQEWVTRRWIVTNVVLLTTACLLMVAIYVIVPQYTMAMTRMMALVYLAQIIFYTLLYIRARKESVRQLDLVFDDEMSGRLRWADILFFSALAVGIFALVWALLPYNSINVLFTVSTSMYYIFAVAQCLRFSMNENILIKAVRQMMEPARTDEERELPAETAPMNDDEQKQVLQAERKVLAWRDAGGCFLPDLSVDEIIDQIGISRITFDYYFNVYLGTHFRTWRIEQRMQEAKRLMQQESHLSTAQLMERVGYNDRSNFHKHFRQYVGCTLSEYREQIKGNKV